MSQNMDVKDFDDVSFDTVTDDHIFSLRFEKRQRELVEKVKKEECNRYKGNMKKWKVAVAAMVLVIGIPGVVGAAELFKVENMLISKENTTADKQALPEEGKSDNESKEDQEINVEQSGEQRNIIALAIPETPEWKAAQEWLQYCTLYERSYQYEEGILMEDELFKQGDIEGRIPDNIDDYGAYTMDMVEKLDELCEKYNLQLQGERVDFESYDEVLANMQLEPFIGSDYQLESVEFAAYGGKNWSGYFDILDKEMNILSEGVSISVSKQGFLDNGTWNLGDLSDYDEWNYTNQNGDKVDIVINYKEEYCVIFYKGEKDFAVVHVEPEYTYYRDDMEVNASTDDWWTRYETTMPTKEQVQMIADAFLFSNIAD